MRCKSTEVDVGALYFVVLYSPSGPYLYVFVSICFVKLCLDFSWLGALILTFLRALVSVAMPRCLIFAFRFSTLPCLALPCLALPCLALPCLALPYLTLPCLAVSLLVCWLVGVEFSLSAVPLLNLSSVAQQCLFVFACLSCVLQQQFRRCSCCCHRVAVAAAVVCVVAIGTPAPAVAFLVTAINGQLASSSLITRTEKMLRIVKTPA